MVEADGVVVTVAPVVELSPPAGAQVYVLAPDAVSNTLLPAHSTDDVGIRKQQEVAEPK